MLSYCKLNSVDQNRSIKHKGHPLNANARKVFHLLPSKKASKAKKILPKTQLKIANLKYENEELTKKNDKLTNALKLKSQQLLNIILYDFVVLTF